MKAPRGGSVRAWLRLLRVPLAPTAACDALACAALARAQAGLDPLAVGPGALAALAATSLCLYGAGMLANDLADRRRDRTLAPDRPLPAGQIGAGAAAFGLALLCTAALVLGGGAAAFRPLVPLALGLALAYDFLLKRWLVPGALAMGGVRALNAALVPAALLDAGRGDAALLLGPLCVGLYSAGVLGLSSTEERPSAIRRRAGLTLAGVAFAGAAALAWATAGGPTLGALVAFGVVSSVAFGRRPRPGPVKRQVLEMLLALYWLALVLASGASRAGPGFVFGTFGAAVALVWGSQRAVRALRPRPAGAAP